MSWKKRWYVAHRWIALIVGLQLLAWSIGGFMFTILDIDDVHGDLERRPAFAKPVRVDRIAVTASEAVKTAVTAGLISEAPARLRLRERFDRTVYELLDQDGQSSGAVDAVTGEVLATITEQEAREAALADFEPQAEIASLRLLEGEPPLEFRGGTMPVYQVIMDHPKEPHLYISPVTGEVLKRRNRPWRLFDFFWMLHIMDYSERDDFNHPLLTAASVLAILTSVSGLVLWTWRIPLRRRNIA